MDEKYPKVTVIIEYGVPEKDDRKFVLRDITRFDVEVTNRDVAPLMAGILYPQPTYWRIDVEARQGGHYLILKDAKSEDA